MYYKYPKNLLLLLERWKSKTGETYYATPSLIEEIMESMGNFLKNEFPSILRKKIREAQEDETYEIENAPGSYRAFWCSSLGSFTVNINYYFNFEDDPDNDEYYVPVNFDGYDIWDFEFKEGWDPGTIFHNIFEELIPSLIAGDGKPFRVEYKFKCNVHVSM